MAEYQLTQPEEPCAVIRMEDGACIPPDPANRDYAEYLKWKDEGNEPDPYVEPEVPEPEPTEEAMLLYDHENRIRAIEGEPPLSVEDFKAMKSRT
jgi:hypothetical protein